MSEPPYNDDLKPLPLKELLSHLLEFSTDAKIDKVYEAMREIYRRTDKNHRDCPDAERILNYFNEALTQQKAMGHPAVLLHRAIAEVVEDDKRAEVPFLLYMVNFESVPEKAKAALQDFERIDPRRGARGEKLVPLRPGTGTGLQARITSWVQRFKKMLDS